MGSTQLRARGRGVLSIAILIGLAGCQAPAVPGQATPSCTPDRQRHLDVEIAQGTRSALVHVPDNATPSSPTVVAIHGAGQSAVYMEAATGLSTKADELGFVAVYPQAEGADWDLVGRRDVEYVLALLAEVSGRACNRQASTYVVGFSRGGGLAHRIACDLSGSITGFASVSGMYVTDAIETCEPTRPLPVLAVHGTADEILPYEGGSSPDPAFELAAVEAWAERWAVHNGCDAEPVRQETPTPEVTVLTWQGCEAPVELQVVTGGTHAWYGGPMETAARQVDGTELVIEFVSRWSDDWPP